jgi:hypothetical protein
VRFAFDGNSLPVPCALIFLVSFNNKGGLIVGTILLASLSKMFVLFPPDGSKLVNCSTLVFGSNVCRKCNRSSPPFPQSHRSVSFPSLKKNGSNLRKSYALPRESVAAVAEHHGVLSNAMHLPDVVVHFQATGRFRKGKSGLGFRLGNRGASVVL